MNSTEPTESKIDHFGHKTEYHGLTLPKEVEWIHYLDKLLANGEIELVQKPILHFTYKNPDYQNLGREIKSPKVFIGMMIHGDEYLQGGFLERLALTIQNRRGVVPDFVLVPFMSPSATKGLKRENKNGIDLGRSFPYGANSKTPDLDDEVRVVMELVEQHGHFDLATFIHNSDIQGSYVYIQPATPEQKLTFRPETFRRDLRGGEVRIYNGLENVYGPDFDPYMNTTIRNGICFRHDWKEDIGGNFIESWFTGQGTVAITAEQSFDLKKRGFAQYSYHKALFEHIFLPIARSLEN